MKKILVAIGEGELKIPNSKKSMNATLNKAHFPINHPVLYRNIPHVRDSILTYLILSLTYLILIYKRPFLIYNSEVRAYDRDVILENLK